MLWAHNVVAEAGVGKPETAPLSALAELSMYWFSADDTGDYISRVTYPAIESLTHKRFHEN